MGTAVPFMHLYRMGAALGIDLVRFLGAGLRSRTAVDPENAYRAILRNSHPQASRSHPLIVMM